jgi:nucleotide-binding universal stress UspA family protein
MAHDFKKILFTTDLSQSSKEVFDYAASLAVESNATVLILHVIEDEESRTKDLIVDMIGSEAFRKIQQENETYARTILLGKQTQAPIIKEALEKLGRTASSKNDKDLIEGVIVRMGRIVEEILQISNEEECDVIVMGHHQKSMLTKSRVGRTIRGVISKSKKPVFLVPLDS